MTKAIQRDELWRRLTQCLAPLRGDWPDPEGVYVGLNDDEVVFRVQRAGSPATAVALYVSLHSDSQTARLLFRLRTVVVGGGCVMRQTTSAVAVSYDARADRYMISTPPVEEGQMAAFFLQRATGLLRAVSEHEPYVPYELQTTR